MTNESAKFLIRVWRCDEIVYEIKKRFIGLALAKAYSIICENPNDFNIGVDVYDMERDECIFSYRLKGLRI